MCACAYPFAQLDTLTIDLIEQWALTVFQYRPLMRQLMVGCFSTYECPAPEISKYLGTT